MIRVRFHGRGGHGIKTASRILGTAAFLSGMEVQDFPVYGAERRGAAVAAFTRIDSQPIQERGVIRDPDLILVADETLLKDPTAGVLGGLEGVSTLFVNSPGKPQELATLYDIPCPIVSLDLTGLTSTLVGRGAALSAGMGAVGCALAGIAPLGLIERAVRDELEELHISPELVEKNVELAREVYPLVSSVPLRERKTLTKPCELHTPTSLSDARGVPALFAVGNASQRHTGSWRIFRPNIDRDACTRCGICLVRCPDGAISMDSEGYPVIDYDNCKGCMICCEECPIRCIEEQKEVRAW